MEDGKTAEIRKAETSDIAQLYALQLLCFESEAEMFGSRDIPALKETPQEHQKDFENWTALKLEDDFGKIIGSI